MPTVNQLVRKGRAVPKVKSKSPFVIAMPNGDPLTESSFDRLWGLIEARTTEDPKKLARRNDICVGAS